MPRTITRDRQELGIEGLGGVKFPAEPYSTSVVTITFRAGPQNPSTGLHWHETHTEYLEIIQGYALVTIGDRTAVFSSADGVITIPRYTVHQYSRWEGPEGKGKDVDLVLREWTDPGDGDKEVFFRNGISLLLDRGENSTKANVGMLVGFMVVAWGHDNYSVFWSGPGFLGQWTKAVVRRTVTYAVMGSVDLVGRWFMGARTDYPEYTPPRKSER
jgi:mannose-6-phosphate isomerase-like protein (cupin superfamily)